MRFKELLKYVYIWFSSNIPLKYIWEIREHAAKFKLVKRKYDRLMKANSAYIEVGASFEDRPRFSHGLNGIFISSGAKVGKNCVIFH